MLRHQTDPSAQPSLSGAFDLGNGEAFRTDWRAMLGVELPSSEDIFEKSLLKGAGANKDISSPPPPSICITGLDHHLWIIACMADLLGLPLFPPEFSKFPWNTGGDHFLGCYQSCC